MLFRIFLILFFTCLFYNAKSAVFYINPETGDISNDGSLEHPWSTLEEVLDANKIETQSYSPVPYDPQVSILVTSNVGAPVKGGDTLYLANGYHGDAFIRGAYNLDFVTIMAQPGHHPCLRSFHVKAGKNWKLEGLSFNTYVANQYLPSTMVFIETHGYHGPSRDVIVKDCTFTNGPDAENWTIEEWQDRVSSAIVFKGNNMHAINNYILNIDEGINLSGDSCSAIGNSVINFAGDGMRAQGSDLLFERNLIKNCFKIDGNHDDGIQAFTNVGNPFERNIIRSNTIINHENHSHPLKGTLQGIGCFDGPYVDWVIENNLIIVDHYHGISLYGAYNCKITNNTVIDPLPTEGPGPCWIRINPHKDGTASADCEVYNNLTSGLSIAGDQSVGNNIISNSILEYEDHFIDHLQVDFRLKANSTAIDAAVSNATGEDIDGRLRTIGLAPDVGAYESLSFNCSTYASGKIFVSEDGIGAGDTWGTAIGSVADGLLLASECPLVDSVFVKSGSYLPTTALNRNISFTLGEGIGLYGGFVGNEESLSARNSMAPTYLSGDIGLTNNQLDNSIHVLRKVGESTAYSVLDGFIIRDGNAGLLQGAGLKVEAGLLEVRNCTFKDNTSLNVEGVIQIFGNNTILKISDLTIE